MNDYFYDFAANLPDPYYLHPNWKTLISICKFT